MKRMSLTGATRFNSFDESIQNTNNYVTRISFFPTNFVAHHILESAVGTTQRRFFSELELVIDLTIHKN
jgi:hypothetical protein